MNKLRLLIVEDVEQDLQSCRDAVEDYKREKERDIELVECRTLDEAKKKLNRSFDGAIIDLTLSGQEEAGILIIEEIRKLFFRIPIFIFTGALGDWEESIEGIEVFRKNETEYYNLLEEFWDTYETGLTRIMGGEGKIEDLLGKVFLENLLLQRKKWVSYGKTDLQRTENALLRYALNHLLQLLDEDGKPHFPEEVYLYPHVSEHITTGSIVNDKTNNQQFAILSPACDLVIRNGESNTDHVLLVEIEEEDKIVEKALHNSSSNRDRKNRLKNLFTNRTTYYHWLPETDFFDGGFLNFRKLKTLNKADLDEQFEKPWIQISPPFVKDVVSRFSSYYARQGQPDIDSANVTSHYIQQQGTGP